MHIEKLSSIQVWFECLQSDTKDMGQMMFIRHVVSCTETVQLLITSHKPPNSWPCW